MKNKAPQKDFFQDFLVSVIGPPQAGFHQSVAVIGLFWLPRTPSLMYFFGWYAGSPSCCERDYRRKERTVHFNGKGAAQRPRPLLECRRMVPPAAPPQLRRNPLEAQRSRASSRAQLSRPAALRAVLDVGCRGDEGIGEEATICFESIPDRSSFVVAFTSRAFPSAGFDCVVPCHIWTVSSSPRSCCACVFLPCFSRGARCRRSFVRVPRTSPDSGDSGDVDVAVFASSTIAPG